MLTAPRKDSRHWSRVATTWAEVCSWAENPARKKACGNYVLGQFQRTVDSHPGVTGTCTDWHRNKAAVVSRWALALDADSAGVDFLASVGDLGWAAVAHTTFSHTPAEPRFRLLILLDRDVTSAEYERLARVVMHRLGVDQFDRGSVEAWRYMFKPSTPKPVEYEYRVYEGDPLPVDTLLAEYDPDEHGASRVTEGNTEKQDPFDIPGVVGAFNRVFSIEEAIEAFDLPYEQEGGRWHLAGAESGAGLAMLDEGLAYSHHASDPANTGHACHAFDLVRLHRFKDADAKVTPGTPVHRTPSHLKMSELAMTDERVLSELNQSTAQEDFAVEGEAGADGRVPVLLKDQDQWMRNGVGRGKLADVFRRGGQELVSVALEGDEGYIAPDNPNDENGPSQVTRLTSDSLMARVMYRHVFFNESGNRVIPAQRIARQAAAAPDLLPNVRDLRGVTDFPLVRPDGSLLNEPGYDPESGLYYVPRGPVLSVPNVPTAREVAAAKKFLEYIVKNFDFVSPNDRANFIGLMVAPVARLLIEGLAKGVIIGAPSAGSGKSLLSKILTETYGGVRRGSWPSTEDEIGKVIGAVFDTTASAFVVFDNVRGKLESAKVEALLTDWTYTERRLGANTLITGINDRTCVWTANNLRVGQDLARRIMRVTIDPNMPKPYERPASDFKEPFLLQYVREHRAEITRAALTLVRAWVLAGSPVASDVADDFARWRGVTGGVLAHAGIEGEFDAKADRAEAESDDDTEWAAFLAMLWDVVGDRAWRASEVALHIVVPEDPETIPEALALKVGSSGDSRATATAARSLGKWLANRADHWVGGHPSWCVRRAGTDRKGIALWKLQRRDE